MHVWVWHLFVFDTWYHLCMHVLHTCSCIYQLVYYILEAHKIIRRFFCIFVRSERIWGLFFAFLFFECYSNLEVLEGALLHFTHGQKSRTPSQPHHPPLLQSPNRARRPRPVQPFSLRDGLGRPGGPQGDLLGPEPWSATGWDKEWGCWMQSDPVTHSERQGEKVERG